MLTAAAALVALASSAPAPTQPRVACRKGKRSWERRGSPKPAFQRGRARGRWEPVSPQTGWGGGCGGSEAVTSTSLWPCLVPGVGGPVAAGPSPGPVPGRPHSSRTSRAASAFILGAVGVRRAGPGRREVGQRASWGFPVASSRLEQWDSFPPGFRDPGEGKSLRSGLGRPVRVCCSLYWPAVLAPAARALPPRRWDPGPRPCSHRSLVTQTLQLDTADRAPSTLSVRWRTLQSPQSICNRGTGRPSRCPHTPVPPPCAPPPPGMLSRGQQAVLLLVQVSPPQTWPSHCHLPWPRLPGTAGTLPSSCVLGGAGGGPGGLRVGVSHTEGDVLPDSFPSVRVRGTDGRAATRRQRCGLEPELPTAPTSPW